MLPQEGQECKKGSQNSNLRMTQMGKEEEAEEATLIFQAPCLKKVSMYDTYGEKVIMEEENEEFGSTSSVESSMEDSEDSTICSLSSSEVAEDACSPPSCPPPRSPSSSSPPDGPLFELSELMAQLPIKRGLSRYYQGKSQSYTSLASVKSVEDLQAKKESYNSICHYKMKIKSCRSYGWGLDAHNSNNHRCFSPKATISKKGRPASSRGRVLCLL